MIMVILKNCIKTDILLYCYCLLESNSTSFITQFVLQTPLSSFSVVKNVSVLQGLAQVPPSFLICFFISCGTQMILSCVCKLKKKMYLLQSKFPQTSSFCSLLQSHSLTHRNLLHFLMPTMKYQKVKESSFKIT